MHCKNQGQKCLQVPQNTQILVAAEDDERRDYCVRYAGHQLQYGPSILPERDSKIMSLKNKESQKDQREQQVYRAERHLVDVIISMMLSCHLSLLPLAYHALMVEHGPDVNDEPNQEESQLQIKYALFDAGVQVLDDYLEEIEVEEVKVLRPAQFFQEYEAVIVFVAVNDPINLNNIHLNWKAAVSVFFESFAHVMVVKG